MASKLYVLNNLCEHVFSSGEFYVYVLRDPSKVDSPPFYVGKGRDDRAWRHVSLRKNKKQHRSNPHKVNTINAIIDCGHRVIVDIVGSFVDEDAAFELERKLIEEYGHAHDGTGILTNINKGGEGATRAGIPVCQFDRFGKFMCEYSNAKEAARTNGWSHYSTISACCKGREVSYKGFYWAYKGSQTSLSTKKKLVYQWSLTGELIATHETIASASRAVGCDPSTIRDNITGTISAAVGFVWAYTPSFPGYTPAQGKSRAVVCITTGVTYSSVTQAACDLKLQVQAICDVCKNKRPDASGLLFRYQDCVQ